MPSPFAPVARRRVRGEGVARTRGMPGEALEGWGQEMGGRRSFGGLGAEEPLEGWGAEETLEGWGQRISFGGLEGRSFALATGEKLDLQVTPVKQNPLPKSPIWTRIPVG